MIIFWTLSDSCVPGTKITFLDQIIMHCEMHTQFTIMSKSFPATSSITQKLHAHAYAFPLVRLQMFLRAQNIKKFDIAKKLYF